MFCNKPFKAFLERQMFEDKSTSLFAITMQNFYTTLMRRLVIFFTHSQLFLQSIFSTSGTANQFKACVRYFLSIFLFFHLLIALQKLLKCFLFHLKSSFCFQDIQIFVFFLFFSTLSRFKRTNGSGIINVMHLRAKICRCNFWNDTRTALHYTIKLGQIIYN